MSDAEAILKSFLDEVPSIQTTKTIKDSNNKEKGKEIFIVHGHYNEILLEVKNFINSLELHPIILHEQPSENKTVIEKLEKHSEQAEFAVILLTPDDEGYPKGRVREKIQSKTKCCFRIRIVSRTLGRANVEFYIKKM